MSEFYVETESFAAPFFSDSGHRYVTAVTAEKALEVVAATYRHPAGLYAAAVYTSADAKNKGEKPLAMWLCNHARVKREKTAGLGCYGYLGHGPGRFEIDGTLVVVPDPKGGSVVQPC